jgi:hypothetical protein
MYTMQVNITRCLSPRPCLISKPRPCPSLVECLRGQGYEYLLPMAMHLKHAGECYVVRLAGPILHIASRQSTPSSCSSTCDPGCQSLPCSGCIKWCMLYTIRVSSAIRGSSVAPPAAAGAAAAPLGNTSLPYPEPYRMPYSRSCLE